MSQSPIGPGFFIFFSNDSAKIRHTSRSWNWNKICEYGEQVFIDYIEEKKDIVEELPEVEEIEVKPGMLEQLKYRIIRKQIKKVPKAVNCIAIKEKVSKKKAKVILFDKLYEELDKRVKHDDDEMLVLLLILDAI